MLIHDCVVILTFILLRKYSILTVYILIHYVCFCYNVWVNELMAPNVSSKSGQRVCTQPDTHHHQISVSNILATNIDVSNDRTLDLLFVVIVPVYVILYLPSKRKQIAQNLTFSYS
jgi:hypothetical protein